jgi:integrase
MGTKTATINVSKLHQKIDLATAGLQPYLNRMLRDIPAGNAAAIADYVIAMQSEINPTIKHRKNLVFAMMHFSSFLKHKAFKSMKKEDVLQYLDSYRKPDESDPLHKWVGTYNLRRASLVKFFRWLYAPDVPADDRPVPAFLSTIRQLRRKEISIYKPSDLWTEEDDALFLKYCPDKRIRCYHAMSRDTSARPHELLKLRIRDVVFKTSGGVQYAEVVLSGKTTQRPIPLFASLPYLKDWLDEHPLRSNPDSPLFVSLNRGVGRPLTENSLHRIYALQYNKGIESKRDGFYEGYFRRLLKAPDIPPEDKAKIEALLQKPWNPYVRRHSALTEKARLLKEHTLRQHAGWGMTSRMPAKYIHFFGGESSETLLEAYGIVKRDKTLAEVLKPVTCPSCKELNKIDAKFCTNPKCRHVLTYDAYEEEKNKRRDLEDKVNWLVEAEMERRGLEQHKDELKRKQEEESD